MFSGAAIIGGMGGGGRRYFPEGRYSGHPLLSEFYGRVKHCLLQIGVKRCLY